MQLLDLPADIIDEIIGHSLPSGFEAFALCCRAIYTRAAPKIARHNLLKQRWKCTTIAGSKNQSDILRILCEIACDPLVGQYIESLSLRGHGGGPNVDTKNDRFKSNEKVMASIKNMVLHSECFNNAGVDAQLWWEVMLRGFGLENEAENEDNNHRSYHRVAYATVTLLNHLPNLQALELPPEWYSLNNNRTPLPEAEERLEAVLKTMVEASNSSGNRNQPLAKLRIILPSTREGYEERNPFQVLEPFVRLNSLEELYSTSCLAIDDGYTGMAFHWRFPGINSSLRRVELAYCCMDAEGISVLLRHTPCLEIFRYLHECKWHGCGYDWNPGGFVEAIAEHCGPSITELTIKKAKDWGAIVNGVVSFRAFPQLRMLEIDLASFCGPSVASGQRLGEDAVQAEEGEKPWTIEDIPCLGDMLPESIVDVQIDNNGWMDDPPEPEEVLKLLLQGFPEKRVSRLRNLAQVTLSSLGDAKVRALAEGMGVQFVSLSRKGARNNWPCSSTVQGYSDMFKAAAKASNDADTRPRPVAVRRGRSTVWVYPES